MTALILKNAKIFTEGSIKEGEIAIEQGKIQKIAKLINLDSGTKKIDCNGNLVLPGLIDIHVHLRDLDLSYKEDFFSGTSAALAGGVTTVLDMPNTKPRTDVPKILKLKMEKARKKIVSNVGFYSGIPENFEDLPKLNELGPIGYKLYPDHPYSNLDFADNEQLKALFIRLTHFHRPFVVHPEEKNTNLKIEKYKEQNLSDIDAFLKAHNNKSENSTVTRCISILSKNIINLHFAHISTAESVEIITKAKSDGVSFTAEVTPHHLLLDYRAIENQGAFAKMVPPLRRKIDREALWHGINSGNIDIISTDHAPHSIEEKKSSFLDAPSGIPGLETSLSLMLTCINRKKISIQRLIELYAENPAKIFQIEGKGKIKVGYDADLVIVDLKKKTKINSDRFLSKAHHTPFEGVEVQGLPIMTILAGKVVMDSGKILAREGAGSVIKGKKF